MKLTQMLKMVLPILSLHCLKAVEPIRNETFISFFLDNLSYKALSKHKINAHFIIKPQKNLCMAVSVYAKSLNKIRENFENTDDKNFAHSAFKSIDSLSFTFREAEHGTMTQVKFKKALGDQSDHYFSGQINHRRNFFKKLIFLDLLSNVDCKNNINISAKVRAGLSLQNEQLILPIQIKIFGDLFEINQSLDVRQEQSQAESAENKTLLHKCFIQFACLNGLLFANASLGDFKPEFGFNFCFSSSPVESIELCDLSGFRSS